uniref:AMP-dependent synthetase/ligase domain-containing protein n=1 Tax=Arion vulgaris TaxID=1028688 RepID=A0A0B7BMS0_9EUPU
MGTKQSHIHKLDTVSKRVQFLAEEFPDRELFVFYEGEKRDSYTAKLLLQLAGKFAYRLRHQYGFKRNDIIANSLPNSPERLITDLGIILAGCTAMNVSILLADGSDFFRSAKNSRCGGVVLRPEEGAAAWRLVKQYVTKERGDGAADLSYGEVPDLHLAIYATRNTTGTSGHFLEDLRASNEEVFVEPNIVPDDLLYIFATSGSTGYSKLIPRTHFEIIDLWVPIYNMNLENHVLYSDRSLGWAGGFPFGTYCNGDKRVLLDWFDGHGARGGEDMWRAITKDQCTFAVILPLDFDNLHKYILNSGDSDYKLKILATGGQPVKRNQIGNMLTVAEQVMLAYGSTEALYISYALLKDTNVEDFLCGKPFSGMSVRIVNESGQNCKPRETGTVHLKGKTVFKGFFNRLENPDPNTAKSFTKDGWFDTEDVGYYDESENIYILGRTKDTIIHGIAVLYPGWLEAKILTHPDILDACVVPVTDPVLYHNICACVKVAEGSGLTEQKLKQFCEKIFLSDLEYESTPMPKYFVIMDNFPKTFTGKPDKRVLTAMAEEKFGYKESKP